MRRGDPARPGRQSAGTSELRLPDRSVRECGTAIHSGEGRLKIHMIDNGWILETIGRIDEGAEAVLPSKGRSAAERSRPEGYCHRNIAIGDPEDPLDGAYRRDLGRESARYGWELIQTELERRDEERAPGLGRCGGVRLQAESSGRQRQPVEQLLDMEGRLEYTQEGNLVGYLLAKLWPHSPVVQPAQAEER